MSVLLSLLKVKTIDDRKVWFNVARILKLEEYDHSFKNEEGKWIDEDVVQITLMDDPNDILVARESADNLIERLAEEFGHGFP